MYEVEEKDLQLSVTFKKAQEKLLNKKQEIIAVNKKENNDTIEASLLFLSNIEYFKNKYKGSSVSKHMLILDELQQTFKNANLDTLATLLNKNRFYSLSVLTNFFTICILSIASIPISYLFYTYGLTFNTLLTKVSLVLALTFVLYANLIELLVSDV